MAAKSKDITRYGIGEWYGHRIENIHPNDKVKYAETKGIKKIPCPYTQEPCNKNGGVCTLALYKPEKDGGAKGVRLLI